MHDSGKVNAHVIAWSYDKAGHAQIYVEQFCELANKKKSSSCKKSPHLVSMITSSKKNNRKQWKN